MGDAAMPRQNKKFVVREKFAEDVGVRKNRARISDQVMIRWRFSGCVLNMSCPRNAALAMSAPAMP